MTSCVKAQTIFFEGFESGVLPSNWTLIDADGDHVNWKHSNELLTPGVGHNSTYCMLSQSFDNNTGPLTPDNWLITPAINLSGACILKFYVCGQDASYSAEHYGVYISTTNPYSTTNFTQLGEWTVGSSKEQSPWTLKTVDLSNYSGTVYIAFRHFNSTNEFCLDIDDITVLAQPTTPTIDIITTSFSFNNVIFGNSSAAQTCSVIGYNLTDSISAYVSAPFEVSTDGTNFGTTANLATSGDNLYIRYVPTSVGNDTGTVTLSSSGANDVTITLNGTCIDCSEAVNTFPWSEDFNSGIFPPACWEIENTSADTTWEAFDYPGIWASCLGTSYPRTEKLISKNLDFSNLTQTILMDIDFMSNYDYINDSVTDFKIYASTDGGVTFDTNPIWKLSQYGEFISWSPTSATIDLSSLAGQSNVRLAFTYEGSEVQVLFSNVNIYDFHAETILLNKDTLSFYGIAGESYIQTVDITTYDVVHDITATTTAPFSISTNSTSYDTTATFSTIGGTLYVKYTAQVGSQTGNVTLTSGNGNKTLTLRGTGVDCSTPSNLPFEESFETELSDCWLNVDNDGDGFTWVDNAEYMFEAHSGTGCMISASFIHDTNSLHPDNWLITPTISIPNQDAILSYWVATQGSNNHAEHYEVKVSTSGTSLSDFTPIFNDTISSDNWENRRIPLSTYAGQNIRIAYVHQDANSTYLKLDDINITLNTGILSIENSANIYPNPSNNILHIHTNSIINSIELFNMMGQRVAVYDATGTDTQISTSHLIPSIYLIRIHTENGVINQKFMVAR